MITFYYGLIVWVDVCLRILDFNFLFFWGGFGLPISEKGFEEIYYIL